MYTNCGADGVEPCAIQLESKAEAFHPALVVIGSDVVELGPRPVQLEPALVQMQSSASSVSTTADLNTTTARCVCIKCG